jgi:hypothetical protein
MQRSARKNLIFRILTGFSSQYRYRISTGTPAKIRVYSCVCTDVYTAVCVCAQSSLERCVCVHTPWYEYTLGTPQYLYINGNCILVQMKNPTNGFVLSTITPNPAIFEWRWNFYGFKTASRRASWAGSFAESGDKNTHIWRTVLTLKAYLETDSCKFCRNCILVQIKNLDKVDFLDFSMNDAQNSWPRDRIWISGPDFNQGKPLVSRTSATILVCIGP